MSRFIVTLFFIITFWSCTKDKSNNKFFDSVLLRIGDLQDRRVTDSLIQYFKSEIPAHRAAAALAFGSIQDTAASPSLGTLLLEDSNAEVRRAAAFALGQTGGIAAVNALIPAVHDHEGPVVSEVLEGLGKTINRQDLELLRNYTVTDSSGQLGLSRAYYRLALRNLADSLMAVRESKFLNPKFSLQTRLAAAHFFGRYRLSTQTFEKELVDASLHDPAAEVRMAVVGGLKKMNIRRALEVLIKIAKEDKDYRVRNSAVRACSNFSLKESQEVVFGALMDSSIAVQISASELILKGAKDERFKRLEDDIVAAENLRVKANLYGAFLSSFTSGHTVKDIVDLYEKSGDYDKAWLLTSLSFAQGTNESQAFDFLSTAMIASKIFVIKSSAASAIVAMNYHPAFFKKTKDRFVEVYKRAITDGDPAVTGIIAGALVDSTLGYRAIIHDLRFLKEAKEKLQLPKDIESLQPLVEAIAYLEGKPKPTPLKNAFNHPMDRELIKSIARDQRVLVKTSKGDIILRLLVEETPGSVANFVGLVKQKYFDGKFVHRVVPNFVIQTGCNRGDGFGSENYSIRSEFSGRRYRTGSVGMASAGKDTEGTQWFITHSPTPHLDGRYTVFAEVVEGQENVDYLEVGDIIASVTLMEN